VTSAQRSIFSFVSARDFSVSLIIFSELYNTFVRPFGWVVTFKMRFSAAKCLDHFLKVYSLKGLEGIIDGVIASLNTRRHGLLKAS
jgi:hypothetical protein